MAETNPNAAADRGLEAPVFAARLHPNRSLGPRGAALVLCFTALAGILVSIPFYLLGAWPVVGFFGLDVLALYLAFRVVQNRARAFEELKLSRLELLYRRVSHRGASSEWRFNPYWVRLRQDIHEEFGTQRLELVEGRRSVIVGSFLGAEEKGKFANALRGALAESRHR